MAKGRHRIAALLIAGGAVTGAAHADPDQPLCLGETVEARAAEIVDARSVRLDDGRVLRLAGIEPFDLLLSDAEDAQADLHSRIGELIRGQALRIRLAAAEPDRYGRFPALVTAAEEIVQETLAREGLAIAFANGGALPCFDRILEAEAEARRAHRGFWAGRGIPPAFPHALAPRVGRFAIFEGTVLSVGNRAARSYLNFGAWWRADVTAEIAAEDREGFGGETGLSALAGRKVRLRGFLQDKDGPLLPLTSPMQLEVLDSAARAEGNAPP